MEAALAVLQGENKSLKRSLTFQRENNHERNVELDALHYVWCDGGCRAGVHRFGVRGELTEEIVQAAERNTKRMRTWLANSEYRKNRSQPIVGEIKDDEKK